MSADSFADFVLKLGAECARRLKEVGVVMGGHCSTCSCHTIRVRRMSTHPDTYTLTMKINGVVREIVYNSKETDTWRMPTEEEWDILIEAIIHPPLIMSPS